MKNDDLEEIIARVRVWPAERREQAVGLLLALERFGEVLYPLTDEEAAELEEAVAEMDSEEPASDAEVMAAFRRREL